MEHASPEKQDNMKKKVTKKIPRKPKIDENAMVQREERNSRCEQLMLKMGTYTQAEIARKLGINIDTARTYISCVKKRWEIFGSHLKLQEARGAGFSRLDKLTRELWDILENEKSRSDVKIKALKALADIHDKRLHLEGVTKKSLQEIPDTSVNGGVNQRKEDATRMKELVRKWSEFLKEHQNPPYDREPSPLQDMIPT